MVNGMYRTGGYLSDLGTCGCQVAMADSSGGFDLSSIPLWVWLVGAGAAFLFLSKKQGR